MKKIAILLAAALLTVGLTGCLKAKLDDTPRVLGASAQTDVDGTLIFSNADFESKNLSGWTVTGDFGEYTADNNTKWWGGIIGQKGKYLLRSLSGGDGSSGDAKLGTASSSIFTIGNNWKKINFLAAGGNDDTKLYVALVVEGQEYKMTGPLGNTETMAKVSYSIPTSLKGKSAFIKVVDSSKDGWGIIDCDDFRYDTTDTTAPVITMNGNATVNLNLNEAYIDAGATATDDTDTNVTIVTSGASIDTSIAGTYYVTYNAVDAAGNHATVKTRTVNVGISFTFPVEVVNGGFETGDLTGWTVVSGKAFAIDNISTATTFWNENIPFNKDGSYFYNGMAGEGEGAVGCMMSSIFKLSGSGWISFKLGGAKNIEKSYIAIMDANSEVELARYGNSAFADINFPNPDQGMRLANMETFKANLSAFIGRKLYIKIVDGATNDWGLMTFDSLKVFNLAEPTTGVTALPVNNEVINGGFETGDLTGWTVLSGNAFIGENISTATTFWNEKIPFGKDGNFFYNGMVGNGESAKGVIKSATFKLEGTGWMTFKMGGGGDKTNCYISIFDAANDTELARYGNSAFADINFPNPDQGMRLANMELYKADLSAHIGKSLYIKVVDDANSGWGMLTLDAINTYHTTLPTDGVSVVDIKP